MRATSETATVSILVKKVPAFYGMQNFIEVIKKTVTDPAVHSPKLHFLLMPFSILLPPAFPPQVLRPKFSEHTKNARRFLRRPTKRKKANYIRYILRRNCLLKHVIEDRRDGKTRKKT
jgi:hypothetical protein